MRPDLGGAEPAALQMAIGEVCAASGKIRSETLTTDPQGYAFLARQPWLNGTISGEGSVRQFVPSRPVPARARARPGIGATVEGEPARRWSAASS